MILIEAEEWMVYLKQVQDEERTLQSLIDMLQEDLDRAAGL